MEDLQGIVAALHVRPREVAPSAANGVENPAVGLLKPRHGGQNPIDMPLQILTVEIAQAFQAQWAQRQGRALAQGPAGDIDHLQAATAKVADHAIGVGKPADDTVSGVFGLIATGQHDHVETGLTVDLTYELLAIESVAHRRCREYVHPHHRQCVQELAKTPQTAKRGGDRRCRQAPGFGQTSAQTAQGFFIEHRDWHTATMFIHHHPHRVGADVDDRHPRRGGLALAVGDKGQSRTVAKAHGRWSPGPAPSSPFCLSALPRPDRLGLIMK